MNKSVPFILLALYLISSGLLSCKQANGDGEIMRNLYWMEGEWKGRVKGGMMFETWVIAEDSSIIGSAYTLLSGDTVFSETMKIVEKDGEIYYMVSVAKVKVPVAFKLVEYGPDACVFENPDHDFPTRIVYTNTIGDMLLARIEGVRDNKPDTARFFMHRNKVFSEE